MMIDKECALTSNCKDAFQNTRKKKKKREKMFSICHVNPKPQILDVLVYMTVDFKNLEI